MEVFINIFFLSVGFLWIKYNQRRYISYVNHLSIYGFVWPFITIGAQLAYPNTLSIEVVIFFYICWLLYILGSSLLHHQTLIERESNRSYYYRVKILVLVLVVCCVISNWELFSLIINAGNLNAWAALRKENGFEDLESNMFFTIFQRVYLIYIPLSLYLLYHKKISRLVFIILLLTGIAFSLLKFTRAPLLNLLMILLVSYIYIYSKKLPLFTIIITASIVLIVFISSMLILSSEAKNYNVIDDVNLYLFAGQVSYQDFYDGIYIDNNKYDVGNYSLDFINYILKKVGLIESYPSYVREYSYRAKVFTNTYTYLDCFTYDLGLLGALIGSFLTGLFSDFSYHIYIKRRNIFALIFYGFVCYYNCFVFANNEFIRFSVLLIIVTLLLYNFIVSKKKYVL